MRHGKSGKRFGRKSGWRKATVRDIAKSVLICQRIRTTESRAKESRKLVERLITLGKDGTLAAKRKAFSILCDHKVVSNLFNTIAPLFKSRAGGYTRIIPLGENRRGDNARLVLLELTEKTVKKVAKDSTAEKGAKKDKKDSAPVSAEASKTEAKEPHVIDTKKKEPVKKEEKKVSRVKDSVSKLASGGIRKIFRNKKPE